MRTDQRRPQKEGKERGLEAESGSGEGRPAGETTRVKKKTSERGPPHAKKRDAVMAGETRLVTCSVIPAAASAARYPRTHRVLRLALRRAAAAAARMHAQSAAAVSSGSQQRQSAAA
eukprot:107487-Pleurochrysis_carterae.AAC.1